MLTLAMASLAAAVAGPAPLRFGVASPTGAADAEKAAKLIEAQLARELGRPVAAVVAAGYDALADDLAAGKVDAAWITPLSYARAKAKAPGITAVAKMMRNAVLFYRSVIFSRAESGIGAPDDLVGKRIAWVDRGSASGYVIPWALLARKTKDPAALFKEQKFLGDHLAVCKAVLAGEADAGATFADEPLEDAPLEITACKGLEGWDKLVVVAQSGPLTNDVVAVRAGLPVEDSQRLRGALDRLEESPEGQAMLKEALKAEGFANANERDFDAVKAAAKYAPKQ